MAKRTQKHQPNTHSPIHSLHSSSFPHNSHQYQSYFDKLNNRTDPNKQSRITSCSQYMHTFQTYSKKDSLIDSIRCSFDNGYICDLFQHKTIYKESTLYTLLPNKQKNNIQIINHFFNIGNTQQNKQVNIAQPLSIQNYCQALSAISFCDPVLEQQTKYKQDRKDILQQIKSDTMATKTCNIQTKVDLLLAEIGYQKKRKEDCHFYAQAMQLKLNQFVEYVVGDYDHLFGLTLQDKSQEILNNIESFKGQVLDGWLVIVLLEIFFWQLKDLQLFRLNKIKQKRRKEQKNQIQSQREYKHKQNGSRKGYSEPNSRRGDIREDQWIGKLQ